MATPGQAHSSHVEKANSYQSCDFSGELALDLKDRFRARGADAAITSFNGDYVGYVIPARYYHLSGYEPRLMSFFGPNVPDYFEDVLRAMALSLWER